MKNRLTYFILCLLFPGFGMLKAQTPSDGIMMKKGEICLAAIYENSWFDHYWEGTYLRTNGTIATVKREVINPMAAFGLTDWLNFLASCPYVSTRSSEPNGGKFEGASGFQDLGLALKAEFLNKTLGKGNLTAFGVVGYSTPITNYLSDYRPYSIGFGADQLTVRGILQYQIENGLYFRGALAYLKRGSTEAERDYYYNNGSFYTAWMDVPSAWNYQLVAGKWMLDNSLKLELNYQGLISTSGDDVRAYNAAQPTNKVDFGQLGFSAQYYFKKLKGLGILAYANQVLSGRNIGKTTALGGGFTYQFKVY